MDVLIGVILGGMLGSAVAALWMQRRRAAERLDLSNARQRSELLDASVARLEAELRSQRDLHDRTNAQREEAERQLAGLRERLKVLEDAETRLMQAFAATSAKALQSNNQQFIELAQQTFKTLMVDARGDVEKKQQAIDSLIKPIRELLEKQNAAVQEIEKKREVAYSGLEQQIKSIAASHEKLGTETNRLVTALRRPEHRGRWGEMQLRNVVELAGMTKHCDFVEQPTVQCDSNVQRPDMIVNMPGGGVIVVDAKVALDSYLDSVQPDADRDSLLRRHTELVQRHYRNLSAKRYWEQFERTPKLVVMFMPLESALVAALEHKPELHAEAMQNHVLIATPTLLVALLRAVAYGWQQEAQAENAREIARVGNELYERLGSFIGHYQDLGNRLSKAAEAFNKGVGSLETRVMPSIRKLKDLDATSHEDIASPDRVELEVRPVTTPQMNLLPAEPSADACAQPGVELEVRDDQRAPATTAKQ